MGDKKHFLVGCCLRLKDSLLVASRQTRVYEGLGAVGVFIGVSLFCVGLVFTIVGAKGQTKDVIPTFGYSGPVIIAVSIVLIILGYILSNAGNITRIWTYVKKRKQFPYIDYDHYFMNDVRRNVFSVVCFKVIKTCLRVKEGRQLTESAEFSGTYGSTVSPTGRSNSEVICEMGPGPGTCRRRKSSDLNMTSRRSHSLPSVTASLRNSKVSPYTSGSLSDSSGDLQASDVSRSGSLTDTSVI